MESKNNLRLVEGRGWGKSTLGILTIDNSNLPIEFSKHWNCKKISDDKLQIELPLSVLKSAIQKMTRRDHPQLISVLLFMMRCMLYSNIERPLTKQLSHSYRCILSNIRNRLIIFPLEEGSLLMLDRESRKIMSDAYENLCNAQEWELESAVCRIGHLLRCCRQLHCRAISYFETLYNLLHIEDDIRKDVVGDELYSKFMLLREKGEKMEFMKEKKVDKLDLKKFYSLSRKVSEIVKTRMMRTLLILLKKYPGVFGKYKIPSNPLVPHEPGFPSLNEMNDMHVFDRHCGFNTSLVEFAEGGGDTPYTLPDIMNSKICLSGIEFSILELKILYAEEKYIKD